MAKHLLPLVFRFHPRYANDVCGISAGVEAFCLAVLQLRIYAMYGRSKKILVLIISMFCISNAASIAIVTWDLLLATGGLLLKFYLLKSVLTNSVRTDIPVALPTWANCFHLTKRNTYYGIWVPPMAYELLLFGLALYKGYQSFIWTRNVLSESSGRRTMNILVQDSIKYFFMCVSIYSAFVGI